MGLDSAIGYLGSNKEVFLKDLKKIISIPSISSLAEYRTDVRKCAEEIMEQIRRAGFPDIQILNKDSKSEAPIVYASWDKAPGKPTIIIYGHYDVVNAENKHLWKSEPFEATVKDGIIIGRGVSDDKGQILSSLKACESVLKADGKFPLNVKLLYEGEEELDSAALERVLTNDEIVKKLSCDAVFISDGAWLQDDVPTMISGVRGICEFEIKIKGAKSEVHSGVYGGTVANPLNVMVELLEKLWDSDLKVKLPGFYDDVIPVSAADRKEISGLPFNEAEYCKAIGVKGLRGEQGYSPLERVMCRPCMDMVGMWGGHTGVGPRSVIPTEAHAKVSMRLVANQDPHKIAVLIEQYLKKVCPDAVDMEIEFFSFGKPYLVKQDEPMLKHGRRAMEEAFGRKPILARCGASIPIVPVLNKRLGVPVVMCDLGPGNDNAHGYNENFPLDHFYKGIEMYIRLFYGIAESGVTV